MRKRIMGIMLAMLAVLGILPVTAYADGSAVLKYSGELTVGFGQTDGASSLVIWIDRNGETFYANMLMPEEYAAESMTFMLEDLQDGDEIGIKLRGAQSFDKTVIYGRQLIFDEFLEKIMSANESETGGMLSEYWDEIGSERITSLQELSKSDQAAIESVVLNETYGSFEELRRLIDAKYDELVRKREEENNKKNTSSGGGGGGGGGVKTVVRVPEEVKTILETKAAEKNETEVFSDLESVPWAKESINALYDKKIVSGTDKNRFEPERNITRAEFLKLLVKVFKTDTENVSCEFEDVEKSNWAYGYIAAAYSNGLINGVTDKRFEPDTMITRQDAAAILYRFCGKYNVQLPIGDMPQFMDEDEISDYAKDAAAIFGASGIINGVGQNCFAPHEPCSRAMASKIIYGVLEKGGLDK